MNTKPSLENREILESLGVSEEAVTVAWEARAAENSLHVGVINQWSTYMLASHAAALANSWDRFLALLDEQVREHAQYIYWKIVGGPVEVKES